MTQTILKVDIGATFLLKKTGKIWKRLHNEPKKYKKNPKGPEGKKGKMVDSRDWNHLMSTARFELAPSEEDQHLKLAPWTARPRRHLESRSESSDFTLGGAGWDRRTNWNCTCEKDGLSGFGRQNFRAKMHFECGYGEVDESMNFRAKMHDARGSKMGSRGTRVQNKVL
jgi:hypothetical protein